jgi:hypothetical protein
MHAPLLLLLMVASALGLVEPGASAAITEPARIEALIESVARLPGATFVRNGKEHGAGEAASHLRLKWKNAGARVRTAEDFIRYCATGSSLSGRPYRIRFADGREVDSADYFTAELRRIDAAAKRVTPPPAPASTPG